jgi:hypothetical protein
MAGGMTFLKMTADVKKHLLFQAWVVFAVSRQPSVVHPRLRLTRQFGSGSWCRTGVAPVSIFKNLTRFLVFLIHLSKSQTRNR